MPGQALLVLGTVDLDDHSMAAATTSCASRPQATWMRTPGTGRGRWVDGTEAWIRSLRTR
jgi:hypothetical protein